MSFAEAKPLPEVRFSPPQRWQFATQPRRFTDQLRAQYGDVVLFYVGRERHLLTLAPAGAQQILSADPKIFDAFWRESFTGLTGPGSIWVLEPEAHRRERKILSPAFHGRKYRAYGEIIRKIARQKTEKWRPGEIIRAQESTLEISLDVILHLVMGIHEEIALAQSRRIMFDLWHTFPRTGLFFSKLQRRWYPPWARYARAKAAFSRWVFDRLEDRRNAPPETDSVLGGMLAARFEDGTRLQDEAIRDELITILTAGHETTATALAWSLYELGHHPKILKKLRDELEGLGPNPEVDALVKLPFLTAVCNETMRLHTLLPEVARVLVAPMMLFGHTLAAGDSVAVSIMAIHHDPELYPEPDLFRPARFLERSYTPFEFLPFGGGHRRCLGAGLSDYEMRISLAEIVTNWEFEIAEEDVEFRHDIAMGPKKRIPLRILGRRQAGIRQNDTEKKGVVLHEHA